VSVGNNGLTSELPGELVNHQVGSNVRRFKHLVAEIGRQG
jgi:hypothetical protein